MYGWILTNMNLIFMEIWMKRKEKTFIENMPRVDLSIRYQNKSFHYLIQRHLKINILYVFYSHWGRAESCSGNFSVHCRIHYHYQNEALDNISVHQLPQFYQSQWVLPTAWTASVTWYRYWRLMGWEWEYA